MKLLFDQNLSFKLIYSLKDYFPHSRHIKALGLDKSNDLIIRDYAASNKFIIVTQDSDYYDLGVLFGAPPKVIWIRCGNSTTKEIASILIANHSKIIQFFADNESVCLELY